MFSRSSSIVPLLMTSVCALSLEGRLSPGVPIAAQYHSQDSQGLYNYGYSSEESSKQESRSLDGVTSGSYSYVDANGVLQRVEYRADAKNGFQVTGTNIPVAPATPEHPEEITPAFTTLLKNSPEITNLNSEHNKDSVIVNNEQITAENEEDKKTTDEKKDIPQEDNAKKTSDKNYPESQANNQQVQGYFLYPFTQMNGHLLPFQFGPLEYNFQHPSEDPEQNGFSGQNFGLLPIMQPASYPFIGRNVAGSYPLMNSFIPLFGIDNSGLAANYHRIQFYDFGHHKRGFSNINIGNSGLGFNSINGFSRAFPAYPSFSKRF